MIRALLLFAALSTASAALAQSKPDPQPSGQGDPVTPFAATDATMNAAIDEALASLPVFLTHAFTDDGFGVQTAMLKVAIPTVSRGGDEVIWVSNLSQTATGYGGYLANAPVDLGSLRQGDYVEFQAAQINDWAIRSPAGLLHGHYTTRVIAGLPGNDHFWRLLEPDPIPPEWR